MEKQLNVKIPAELYERLKDFNTSYYGKKHKIKNIVKWALEDYIDKNSFDQ